MLIDDTAKEMLVAAASNSQLSRIALVKCLDREDGYDVDVAAEARFVVVDSTTGQQVQSMGIDTGKDGLKIAKCGLVGGTLAWDHVSNKLLLIVGRQILGGHQGAQVGLYDGATLELEDSFSAMSHSFANNAQVLGNGTFLTASLGDQRGIQVARFTAKGHDTNDPDNPQASPTKDSFIAYTYKALHSTQNKAEDGEAGADVYPSTDEVTRYKRSNDNRCYTEIAFQTFISVDNGSASLVFFTGEFPALDYTGIGTGSMVKSRNLAFIKINNDISQEEILSDGPGAKPKEVGGFYNYWGNWINQTVKGVHLLTSFDNRTLESASKPKALRIGANRILLMFEVWTHDGERYDRTMALVIDDNGEVVETVQDLFYDLRLPYSDQLRLVASGGGNWRAVWYTGMIDGRLARFELNHKNLALAMIARQVCSETLQMIAQRVRSKTLTLEMMGAQMEAGSKALPR